ncbi:MAG: 2-dehydropantoate 2-reductase [Terracidiphilus sp.]|jgi:2-dehydropantoate 2-reductase
MARIAIVGVGAIGGALAALLDVAGHHEITLCTRRPLERLLVKTPEGDVNVKAVNVTDPTHAQPADWVLVATKTYDAHSAAAWFPSLCREDTPVAVIQNGVEHRERFAPYMKPELMLPVIIDCPVERQEDGSVHRRGLAQMKVETGVLGGEFAHLFAGSGAQIELTGDFLTAAWRKLCINSVGVLNALTMKPAGVLRDQAMGNLALELAAECVAVGRLEGAQLQDAICQQVLDGYRAQPPDSINSILADRLAGRRTEIDARNGIIVRKGQMHGIPTPLNRMAVALIESLGSTSI